jgi:hypothetical protein
MQFLTCTVVSLYTWKEIALPVPKNFRKISMGCCCKLPGACTAMTEPLQHSYRCAGKCCRALRRSPRCRAILWPGHELSHQLSM